MRNRALHDALRDFTLEAASILSREVQGGHEIPFELVEEPGSGPVLYRYKPLTEEFIGARWNVLRSLPSCHNAADALGSGAKAYLHLLGVAENEAGAQPALRAMLERLWEDASSFSFPEERFDRVYEEVERTLYEHTLVTAVVAPLHGVELERDRVELGDGLVLLRGSGSEAPAEAVWPLPGDRERGAPPNTVVMLERDTPSGGSAPVTEARLRFRRLLAAMRLFKSGGVSLGPLAWTRSDSGPWQPLPLAPSGYARGESWLLGATEEAPLRELFTVVEASRPGGAIAWALSRFEMGCERPLETEALSDYLIALKALLDPPREEEEGGSFVLRLATLCAEEDGRPALQRRVETALALEQFVMGGGGGDYTELVGHEPPRDIVLGLEDNLRALLQDVICGYLDSDLRAVADALLVQASEEPVRPPEVEPIVTQTSLDTEELEIPAEPDTDELQAVAMPDQPAYEDDSGVTPCADWELDEDAASYSAPV